MVHEIEDFYGVYLLYCMNPKYKGRTYIGYTVNPNRRIKQHNTGKHAGGAHRTSGRGPWEMALIVHGFPNEVSGLRFEWAWQNPDKSRRLRDVPAKSKKENAFQFRWRVVCNMLHIAPWNGLCLTVRWLKQDFYLDFPLEVDFDDYSDEEGDFETEVTPSPQSQQTPPSPLGLTTQTVPAATAPIFFIDPGLEPPLHMPVVFGPVVSKKVAAQKKSKSSSEAEPQISMPSSAADTGELEGFPQIDCMTCSVCHYAIRWEEKTMSCLKPSCSMKAHLTCLARHFLRDTSRLLPVQGTCPRCDINLLWGELVRQMKGCHKNLSESTFQSGMTSGLGGDG